MRALSGPVRSGWNAAVFVPESGGALERAIYLDEARTEDDKKQRNEDEDHQRRDQFDRRFGGLFFSALAPLGAQGIGVHAQGLGDAGAEAVGLNQHADQ